MASLNHRPIPYRARTLGRLRDVLALVFLAAVVSTPAATVGVNVLTIFGAGPAIPYATAWMAWWTGDAIGILLVAPLILTWARGRRRGITARAAVEAGALSIVLVAFTVVLFQAPFSYVYASRQRDHRTVPAGVAVRRDDQSLAWSQGQPVPGVTSARSSP